MSNQSTIVLIIGGDESPLENIIKLLQESGLEIHHASERSQRAARVAIGTPTDLEGVPLPKEIIELKPSPEQEYIFKQLIEIGGTTAKVLKELRAAVRSEKAADAELEEGLRLTGNLPPEQPKRGRGGKGAKNDPKKNEGGAGETGQTPGNSTTTLIPQPPEGTLNAEGMTTQGDEAPEGTAAGAQTAQPADDAAAGEPADAEAAEGNDGNDEGAGSNTTEDNTAQ